MKKVLYVIVLFALMGAKTTGLYAQLVGGNGSGTADDPFMINVAATMPNSGSTGGPTITNNGFTINGNAILITPPDNNRRHYVIYGQHSTRNISVSGGNLAVDPPVYITLGKVVSGSMVSLGIAATTAPSNPPAPPAASYNPATATSPAYLDSNGSGCAFAIGVGTHVILTLADGSSNYLASGTASNFGYAGLHVPQGSKLTIREQMIPGMVDSGETDEFDNPILVPGLVPGSGALRAAGGSGGGSGHGNGGGAGIGGNGSSSGSTLTIYTNSGEIFIEGGLIIATGGRGGASNSAGGGAGIGGGGGGSGVEGGGSYGLIYITGGNIQAWGGWGSSSNWGGGAAGIGGGGGGNSSGGGSYDDIIITIEGGATKVHVQGGNSGTTGNGGGGGAGVGGGGAGQTGTGGTANGIINIAPEVDFSGGGGSGNGGTGNKIGDGSDGQGMGTFIITNENFKDGDYFNYLFLQSDNIKTLELTGNSTQSNTKISYQWTWTKRNSNWMAIPGREIVGNEQETGVNPNANKYTIPTDEAGYFTLKVEVFLRSTSSGNPILGRKQQTARIIIAPRNIYNQDATVTVDPAGYEYDGIAKTPDITVEWDIIELERVTSFDPLQPTRVEKERGYTITAWSPDNTNAGTKTATITGVGNYTGTRTATYTISPRKLSNLSITNLSTSYTYGDGPIQLDVTGGTGVGGSAVAGTLSWSITDATAPVPAAINSDGELTILGQGKFKVTVTKNSGDPNYSSSDPFTSAEVTVGRAGVTITPNPMGVTISFSGVSEFDLTQQPFADLFTVGTTNGARTYSFGTGVTYTATADGEISTEGVLTISRAGDFVIRLVTAETGQYGAGGPKEATLTVTAAPLTVNVATTDRKYNATTIVDIVPTLVGVIPSANNVSILNPPTTGTAASADVGQNISVSIPAINLTGLDAPKYSLIMQPTGITADISAGDFEQFTVEIVRSGLFDNGKITNGTVLTAEVEGIPPLATGYTIAYQWFKNNVEIIGEIAKSYTVADGTDNDYFHVVVESTGNYEGEIISKPVMFGRIPLAGTIEIDYVDDPLVLGSELELNATGLLPAGLLQGTHYTIQWQRNMANITGATGDTYVIVQQDLGKNIRVVVTAADNDHTGDVNSDPVFIPPVKPDAPTITSVIPGNGQVQLVWQFSGFNGGASITYEVSRDDWATAENVGTNLNYTFTGLTNGTEYTFKVRAVNSAGAGAEASAKATPRAIVSTLAIPGVTTPVATKSPVTTDSNAQYTCTITWDPDDDPFGYEKVYTATITLTTQNAFTLQGVGKFSVDGADLVSQGTVYEVTPGGLTSITVTAVFPPTGKLVIASPIVGISKPVATASSIMTINVTGKDYASASFVWLENNALIANQNRFDYDIVYTARVTLTAKTGFTFWGYKNTNDLAGFTLDGVAPTALISNSGDVLVFEVTFPKTKKQTTGALFAFTPLKESYTFNPIPVTVLVKDEYKDVVDASKISVPYYEGTGATIYAKSVTAPTNVGTYRITINYAGCDNYAPATDVNIGTFEITRRLINRPSVTNFNLVYNGSQQSAGIAPSAYYTVSGDKQTNAGSHNAIVSLIDDDNFAWDNDHKTAEDQWLPWSIAPKIINIPAIQGIAVPAVGATPTNMITPAPDMEITLVGGSHPTQYTGSVEWKDEGGNVVDKFGFNTVYRAEITLSPSLPNYTFTGVPASFFTVAGARVIEEKNAGNGRVVTVEFPQTRGENDIYPVTRRIIEGIPVPVANETAMTSVPANDEYSVAITWSPALVDGKYATNTVYSAIIELTAVSGYHFEDVTTDFFKVPGAVSASNASGSSIVYATFAKTDAVAGLEPITIADILGIKPPKAGGTPDRTITSTDQFEGVVTWTPAVSDKFTYGTVYTAIIELTPVNGYTATGVAANFFNVADAKATHPANSRVIAAEFPATERLIGKNIRLGVPIMDGIPERTLSTSEYTATVAWKEGINDLAVGDKFEAGKVYTAIIDLEPIEGVTTLYGVPANYFNVLGAATTTSIAGVVTATFPATEDHTGKTLITDTNIKDIIIPVSGVAPVTTIALSENGQYAGTIVWVDADGNELTGPTFAKGTVYTAIITLIAEHGFTFVNIPADAFTVGGATSVFNAQHSGMVYATFPRTATVGDSKVTDPVINLVRPLAGERPAYTVSGPQFTGEVTWKPAVVGAYAYETVYEATIILTPKAGYTFEGIDANFFEIPGINKDKVKNFANSGIVTATFPKTKAKNDETVNIKTIAGVAVPKYDGTPVAAITGNGQFTGTVKWYDEAGVLVTGKFDKYDTKYTAVITLVANAGWTFEGVPANFFEVAGAYPVTNFAHGDVVTALFPKTRGESDVPVTEFAIQGVKAPVVGEEPVRTLNAGHNEYTIEIFWSPEVAAGGKFAPGTEYTASIVLTAEPGFHFEKIGTGDNQFTVEGLDPAWVSYPEGGSVITVKFPSTDRLIPRIVEGVFPIANTKPVARIETVAYIGTIEWAGASWIGTGEDRRFNYQTAYVATITLDAKPGYTFYGVTQNYFIVPGAEMVTNDAYPTFEQNPSIRAQFLPTRAETDKPVTVTAIEGILVPVVGETPFDGKIEARDGNGNLQYTGTVAWEGKRFEGKFTYNTVYTAIITLTANEQDGWTFKDIFTNDFFTVDGALLVSNVAKVVGAGANAVLYQVVTAVFPITMASGDVTVDIFDLLGITPPKALATPVRTVTATPQYTGTVIWKDDKGVTLPVGRDFDYGTTYVATIILTPNLGFTTQGVEANSFIVAGATSVTNLRNSGMVTARFPATDKLINLAAIGLTAPVAGKAPALNITGNTQFTGTVQWFVEDGTEFTGTGFDFETIYKAIVTLKAKEGFTLTGVPANFFEVTNATSVTNASSSGVVIVIFPKTANKPQVLYKVKVNSIGTGKSGDGEYASGKTVTIDAGSDPANKEFIRWESNDIVLANPNDRQTSFIMPPNDVTVTAIFDPIIPTTFTVTLSVAPSVDYGTVTGAGPYEEGTSATVTATAKEGYNFVNWTENGVEKSTNPSYTFTVTKDVTLFANFEKIIKLLKFEDYVVTKWNNTFLLDFTKLAPLGYPNDKNTKCTWYKVGSSTPVGEGFFYSNDRQNGSPFKQGDKYYFKISNGSKSDESTVHEIKSQGKSASLLAYPNPVQSGNMLTIEGVDEGGLLQVFNQAGVCVLNSIATGNPVTLTLHVPAGLYVVRTQNGEIKIIVNN